jgi:FG-GAP-like repeat/FlgD Ig-like domain
VVSQAADSTRSVHHLTVDGSGLVFDGVLRTVQPVTYYGTAQAVGLDRGTLRFVNSVEGTQTLLGKDVGTGLAPVAGADLPAQPVSGPGRFADGGDEGLARLVTDPASGHDALVTADDPAPVVLPASGGRILDVSPQYVLYEAGDAAREQYVVDIAQNRIVRQQAHQAAVLDYATLWTPSTAEGGTAVATDLRTGAVVRTVTLHGADCVPDDLRTNGTLLYWNCSGPQRAAVQEIDRDRSYPAPSGDVLLSDHLMVAAGSDGTTLTVHSFLNDAEDPVTTISQVKARAAGDTRGTTWTLDRRTGQLAWVDHDEVVHVNRPLMDTWLVSPLSVPDRAAPATFAAQGGAGRWDARWWLSKPARSWQVSLVDAVTGLTVRTWNGGEARSAVRVTWDAKSAAGALVTDGRYTWQLTATPADGQGALATASGTVTATGAAPSPSGLFARDTTGTLWQYRGTGNASAPYGARLKVGTGWQIYTALVAPDGQRANATGDVVARDSAGVLWYYQGSGSPSAPLKARVRVGSGWNPYNQLVGVRDLTGDGRADMVARDGSGVLWLYRGTGSPSAPFAARVKIGAGWNAYGMLTGTGDVTGDGRADMVARDGSGVLWLYRGTGSTSAPFAARTKIGAGWNAYNALM